MSEEHRAEYFTEFRAHTRLKHGVLVNYLNAWSRILNGSSDHLWVIDGFAGKGRDKAGNLGSPLLIAEMAKRLREEGVRISLFAVELKPDWYAALKENLALYDAEREGSVPIAFVRQGECVQHQSEMFQKVGRGPAFCFLDPFGAKGLEIGICRSALNLEQGEVLAFFSHNGVSRHLALIAGDGFEARLRSQADVQPALFPDLQERWLREAIEASKQSDASFDVTQEAARAILAALFGSIDRAEAILEKPRRDWGRASVRAYMAALRECGATHVTPIAIYDEDAKDAYYLIHAAKHPKAAIKIKEALSLALNRSELPLLAQNRMHLTHSVRVEEVVKAVQERFAGQTIRWQGKKVGPTVSEWALGETMMFQSQREDLKKALAPWKTDAKAMTFKFPPR